MTGIEIGNKTIGDNSPCFTIAEAGANHEGDVTKAFQLIDSAKNAGVDAIKFQTYSAEKLTTKTAPKYWDDGISNETQFDVFKKLESISDSTVSVKWYYEEDDEDMLEAGEDYEAIIDLSFEMIEVEEL